VTSTSVRTVIVAEDDPFIRIVQVVLDPATPAERLAAFEHFFAHDEPDFAGWCTRLRAGLPALYPAEVRLVETQAELRAALGETQIVIIESLQLGADELALAPNLRVVQQYGTIISSIDTAACAGRGIEVLTLRRRANIATAEHTIAMLLALAKKLSHLDGLISESQLRFAGYEPARFDRKHTANSGWARVTGLKMLYESTVGIIGLGEIGREVALRVAPFGMRVLYYQRHRLSEDLERLYHVEYAGFEELLGQSDWVSVHVPENAETRNLIDAGRIAAMKPGAVLINTSRAAIIDRDAVLEALKTGHLGGFALDPLYEEPGRPDDELLGFSNVLLTPHTAAQPRFNALRDFEELLVRLDSVLPGGLQ
jgi:phosphoglycerate dehydrogenase-like enzyme